MAFERDAYFDIANFSNGPAVTLTPYYRGIIYHVTESCVMLYNE